MTLLILPAVFNLNKSATPHISASLKFDTIQAIVRQFGRTLDFSGTFTRGFGGAFVPASSFTRKG